MASSFLSPKTNKKRFLEYIKTKSHFPLKSLDVMTLLIDQQTKKMLIGIGNFQLKKSKHIILST